MEQPSKKDSRFADKPTEVLVSREGVPSGQYVIEGISAPPTPEVFQNSCGQNSAIEKMCREIVRILPVIWNPPDAIHCRIFLDGIEYLSDGFEQTRCLLSSDIVVNGSLRGKIEIYNLAEASGMDKPQCSKENSNLTDLFTRTLSQAIRLEEATATTGVTAGFPEENPNPILRTTKNGDILYANKAANELLKSNSQAWPEIVHSTWLSNIEKALQTNCPVEVEHSFEDRIFSFTLVPMPETKCVNIYGKDISERKKAEAQFIQSQKLEAMGLLAGGVAHDFRNQLTIIKGFGEMLVRRNIIPHEHNDKIDMILKAVENSTDLVTELLALSHHEIQELRVVDLCSLTEMLSKAVVHIIGEDIQLSVNKLSEHCRVEIDPTLFNQAMINLIINARDAMPNGGTLLIETDLVEIQTGAGDESSGLAPGKYVSVVITDSGIGMTDSVKERMFQPFFTTKNEADGTGLGLAMVYGFINKSKGHIECESSLGKGTKFSLFFPATNKPLPDDIPQENTSKPTTNNECILLVEDETPIRQMLEMVLSEAGYKVTAVGSPKQAIILASQKENNFDLLVTDIVMPEMTGTELAEHIESSISGDRVLFLSGYTSDELSRRGALSAVRNMLTKPFPHHLLLKRVRETLDMSRKTPSKEELIVLEQ